MRLSVRHGIDPKMRSSILAARGKYFRNHLPNWIDDSDVLTKISVLAVADREEFFWQTFERDLLFLRSREPSEEQKLDLNAWLSLSSNLVEFALQIRWFVSDPKLWPQAHSGAPDTFPQPPFAAAAEWYPIRTRRELRREGREMRNCIATYAALVAARLCFIYHWKVRENATVLLWKDGSSRWIVGDAKGYNNRPLTGGTRALIECHLLTCSKILK